MGNIFLGFKKYFFGDNNQQKKIKKISPANVHNSLEIKTDENYETIATQIVKQILQSTMIQYKEELNLAQNI